MQMETGITTSSAPRSRRRQRLDARDQVKKLRAEFPKANAAQIAELYKARVRELVVFDDDDIEAEIMGVVDDWLSLNVKDPRKPPTQKHEGNKIQRRALVDKIAQVDEARIETAIKIRLLDWLTPYGKKLADCTGAECTRLSKRYGPFLAEIAKRLHPSEHVRNHLSERELQAMAATHRLVGPEAIR